MAVAAGISVGDWDRLEVPEGYRAEVIAGELVVSPSGPPSHGAIQLAIGAVLAAAAPPELVVLVDTEWQVARGWLVAAAPRPDLLVVAAADIANDIKVTAPPLLAVEILSQSDFHLLERAGRPRIEAKRDDYARNGLRHYLEVLLTPERVVRLDRYELHEDRLDCRGQRCRPHSTRSGRAVPLQRRAGVAAALLNASPGQSLSGCTGWSQWT